MLELTGGRPRWPALAAVAAPLLLGAVGVSTYSSAGPVAAIALVAVGSALALGALLLVAGRRVRRADDARHLFERALEAVPNAVFVVDSLRAGRPNLYVNSAYAALTGYGTAEAVSDGFDALALFADPADVAALDAGPTAGTTSRVTVRRRDGTLLAAKLELRAAPRRDGSRYLIGVLEQIENGDRRAQPRPETEDASPATAGRAKDAFLSALSHDLRSPLNACVMWLDVLALSPQSDKLAQAVEAIKRNLARQTRLVNDLNDAAKISSGGLEVRLEPLDLVALLKSRIDAWQLLANSKQITFEQRIEPAAAPLNADAERLAQALDHLVENAIASTPASGRVELRVRTSQDACIVELEDTGPPLSAEDAANLHVPLWRSAASARTRPGLGLGVAVAHHLTQKHSGSLTATSASAAVFTLTLPLAATRARETAALSAQDHRSQR